MSDYKVGAPSSWNAGRQLGAKRPLKRKEVWAIRFLLDQQGRLRDRALFNLAVDSKLRGCDLVKIRVCELRNGFQIRNRATVVQQKTGRPVQFEITKPTRSALNSWFADRPVRPDDFVFPSRVKRNRHLGTRQYARLVNRWVSAIGLKAADYGTHSLRRTKASIIYKQTGNLRAVQMLLGHSKIESTVRYLGVDIEDALELAEAVDI
ncbi:tyrosine-type recombinase/integrase [Parasphingopyxis sp. CP4]|uniref:tyrosine-type recombinase/integrase n=1 Tax=Parasphingopyxis sp. CP4 TaxID=2724527 RepID=UPI0015A060CB|nr:tyrosine-type recombinase/integrase [Parasphingopyxis sp. CP4]QLC21228.1 tyrosine-type recombinase/integrase [Parasphingopyxis sp. CP4]